MDDECGRETSWFDCHVVSVFRTAAESETEEHKVVRRGRIKVKRSD
jgi:hypothetical protein